jgi:hypothetical protein
MPILALCGFALVVVVAVARIVVVRFRLFVRLRWWVARFCWRRIGCFDHLRFLTARTPPGDSTGFSAKPDMG